MKLRRFLVLAVLLFALVFIGVQVMMRRQAQPEIPSTSSSQEHDENLTKDDAEPDKPGAVKTENDADRQEEHDTKSEESQSQSQINLNSAKESEEVYPEEYYTVAETQEADWIISNSDYIPDEETGNKISDDKEIREVEMMVKLLYPEYKPEDIVCGGHIEVDSYTLTAYDIYRKKSECYCVICVDTKSKVYYLYDMENRIYIPIEFNENGVRLLD